MKATVFHGTNDIRVEEVSRPHAGIGEAVIRVTLTTICGTDLHIVRGEYPVKPGLIIGHEPVGVIDELGPGVTGYEIGDRVLVGAITPCGQCRACLSGHLSQCGHGDGYEALGGWRFGNTITDSVRILGINVFPNESPRSLACGQPRPGRVDDNLMTAQKPIFRPKSGQNKCVQSQSTRPINPLCAGRP